MSYHELARRINKRVCVAIKVPADEQEYFELDKQLKHFMKKASNEELADFKQQCFGHEIFVKVILALEHERAEKT